MCHYANFLRKDKNPVKTYDSRWREGTYAQLDMENQQDNYGTRHTSTAYDIHN